MPTDSSQIADLVDQWPDTDAELKATTKPEQAPASTFTGPEPAKARQAFAEILAGGQEKIEELLKLVRMPEDPEFKNYKAGYLVHGLVMYAGTPERNTQRVQLMSALVSQLDDPLCPKSKKAFFIRQLHLMGDRSAVKAIAKHLLDEELCDDAAQALVSIRASGSEGIGRALPQARGKVRLTLLQALGAIRDPDATGVLLEALQADEAEVRLTAARALADLAEPTAGPPLLKLADSTEGWQRSQATQCCLLLAEQLLSAGKKRPAAQIYSHLRDTRTNPKDAYIKAAAEAGLAALK